MNILYLAHRIPYPPNKGDKIRSFNEVKHLAANHAVDLICLADEEEDLQHEVALQNYCRNVFVLLMSKTWGKIRGIAAFCAGRTISVPYFYRHKVQETFDRWVEANNYDAVVCFSSPMAEYVYRSKHFQSSGQGGGTKKPRLIMDFCDIDSDKWKQYAEKALFPLKQVYYTENLRLQAYEKKVYKTFTASAVSSQSEKELFLQGCLSAENMVVIPNGVDTEFFSPHYTSPAAQMQEGLNLVFIGAMDYHANVDGVCWFSGDIFPAVRKRYANAHFYIVGRNPVPSVVKLGSLPGVHVTGNVKDIRPWYAGAEVFVVPLRFARGVQNKMLEAMATGRPIVATAKANAGIGAVDGEHLLIADRAADFANAVTDLLQHPGKRKRLGGHARNFVCTGNTWEEHMAGLERMLLEVRE